MKKNLLILLFAASCFQVLGQYTGGVGCGQAFLLVSAKSLGDGFYRGDKGDGADMVLISANVMGASIYYGGKGDGADVNMAANSVIGFSFYAGGVGDGVVSEFGATQVIGFSVYQGGAGDGNVTNIVATQLMGISIYSGGEGDGNTKGDLPIQFLGSSIYAGGEGDGFTSNSTANQVFGLAIFTGGFGDGAESKLLTNQVFGDAIYVGGLGDGATIISALNRPIGVSIYNGGHGDGNALVFSMNRILPVTLFELKGEWKTAAVNLYWKTASEMNNDYFQIERSSNGIIFYPVTKVKGAGTTNLLSAYNYIDTEVAQQPSVNTWYYRLRSVSFTQTAEVSNTVVVSKRNLNSFKTQVFPNPSSGVCYMETSEPNLKNPSLKVFDMYGKIVHEQDFVSSAAINLQHLSDGMYYIELQDGEELIATQKIVITKP